MSKGLVILGFGHLFHAVGAQFAQQQPLRQIEKHEIQWDEAEGINGQLLDRYSPADWDVFAIAGMNGMNFARLGLFSQAKQRGFKSESFIHASAVVDPGASVGQNCYVGENAVIQGQARLDFNAVIGARSVIAYGAKVGSSAWIGANCFLGAASSVGSHCVIDVGVMIAEGVKVGKFCNLQIARNYSVDVPDKTFHHEMFDQPVRIYA